MRTIEEAANDYYFNGGNDISITADRRDFYAIYASGADFVQQWISVKDELPKVRTRIIIKDFQGINNVAGIYEKSTNTIRSKYLTVSFDIAVYWRYIEIE